MVPTVFCGAQDIKTDSLIQELEKHRDDTTAVYILNDLEFAYELSDFEKARMYIKRAYKLVHRLKWNQGLAVTLEGLCWMYKNNFKPDSTLIYQKELLALGIKNNNHKWTATAYHILGSVQHAKRNFEGAIAAYTKVWQECEKIPSKPMMARAFNNMGNVYSDIASYDSSVHYLNRARDIYISTNNKVLEMGTATNIAVIYVRQGKYDKAIEIFLRNAIEYEKLNDQFQVATNYLNVSEVYDQMKNDEKALTYALKALAIYKKTTQTQQVALTNRNIGKYYQNLGKPDLALKYFNEAKTLYEKTAHEQGIAQVLNNIGSVYQQKGRLAEALNYYTQSLQIKKKLNDINTLPAAYYSLASVQLDLGKPDSALVHLATGEKISLQNHFLPDLKNLYQLYGKVYEKNGNYQKALDYYKLYHQYSDSLIDTEKAKRVSELEAVFEKNKKELENKRLVIQHQQEQIKRIEAEKESSQRTKQVYLVLSIGILLIAFLWFVYQYRRRKLKDRFNRLLVEEKEEGIKAIFTATEEERKRIAKDLHDGIGQQMGGLKLAWQSISSDLHQTNPQLFARLVNLTEVLDETAQEVRNISHRMMPRVLTEMGLRAAIEDMLKKTLEHSTIEYVFESYRVEEKRFDEKIEISLYRICQELVNNVVKHSNAQHLSVQLILKAPYLVLIVEDDGKGFDSKEKQGGIGLMNIHSRVNTVNGKINYEASESAGTVATVRIPVQVA